MPLSLEQIVENYKVDEVGCHIWQGALCPKGYPTVFYGGRQYTVGQLILRLRGEEAKFARPACGNPQCIKSAHIIARKNTHSKDKPKRRSKYTAEQIQRLLDIGLTRLEIMKKLRISSAGYYLILKRKKS